MSPLLFIVSLGIINRVAPKKQLNFFVYDLAGGRDEVP